MKSIKPHYQVFATQGGGLVREDDGNYIFIKAPPPVMELNVGDIMPAEWSIVPINNYWIKEPAGFNWGHFPAGTVIELKDSVHLRDMGLIHTVSKIRKNGASSYVLETTTPGKVMEFFVINIFHVARIIKRGPGNAVLDRSESIKWTKEFFSKERKLDDLDTYHHKSKSTYVTRRPNEFIYHIVSRYLNDTHLLDNEQLIKHLTARGLIHNTNDNEYFPAYVMSKKKLNKAIRQLINKCLLSHHKEQKREEEEAYRDYCNDMRDPLDEDPLEDRRPAERSSRDDNDDDPVSIRPRFFSRSDDDFVEPCSVFDTGNPPSVFDGIDNS